MAIIQGSKKATSADHGKAILTTSRIYAFLILPYFKGGEKDREFKIKKVYKVFCSYTRLPFDTVLLGVGVRVDMMVLGAVAAATVGVSGRSKPHQQMKTRDRKLSK